LKPFDEDLLRAVSRGSMGSLLVALSQGANPNAATPCGSTIFLLACERSANQYEMLKMLLKHGADINRRDQQGRNAAWICAAHGALRGLERIMEDHPDVLARKHGSGETVLHELASCGVLEPIRCILESFPTPLVLLASRDAVGHTPAVSAALNGHTRVVMELLAAGADPRDRASDGRLLEEIVTDPSAQAMVRSLRVRIEDIDARIKHARVASTESSEDRDEDLDSLSDLINSLVRAGSQRPPFPGGS
jgi:serine/threonine-protein phosphatase 6 regulatory ankyrin repeat subunit B